MRRDFSYGIILINEHRSNLVNRQPTLEKSL